ncbi:HipA domain-containing protein [Hydrogenophaga sp. R2]|uniref:HipA domain-containing protein n=1 Tax=Hydrogenophaga sp. R2 TaxID=3132827 RepID=UPI003CEC7547
MELGLFGLFRRFLRQLRWFAPAALARRASISFGAELLGQASAKPDKVARHGSTLGSICANLSAKTSCDVQVFLAQRLNPIATLHFRQQSGASWVEIVPNRSFPTLESFPWYPSLLGTTQERCHLNLDGDLQDALLESILLKQASGFAACVLRQALEGGLLDSLSGDSALDLKLHSLSVIPDAVRLGALSIRPLGAERPAWDVSADFRTRQFLPHISQLESMQVAVHAIEKGLASQIQLHQALLAATAVPGSRPKCTCLDDSNEMWVAKLRLTRDQANVVLWESLTMTIASRLKMGAADHQLRNCAGQPVLLYKRFDRTTQNKLGMVSARSLLRSRPSGLQVGSGLLDDVWLLLDCMRQYCEDYDRDAVLLFRQLLYMWLIGVPGDILRKVNFLQGSGGRIWLAPAVGLRFEAVNDPTSDALAKSQQNRVLSIKALLAAADEFTLTRSDAITILREQDLFLRAWRITAQELSGRMEVKDFWLLEAAAKSIFQVADRVYSSSTAC